MIVEAGQVHTNVRVYLDDVLMTFVKSANDETGEVVVYMKDDKGKFIKSDGQFATETHNGTVRIEFF
jgi:hypothetical protein